MNANLSFKSRVNCHLKPRLYSLLAEEADKKGETVTGFCSQVLEKYALGVEMKQFEQKNIVIGGIHKRLQQVERTLVNHNIEILDAISVLIELFRINPKTKDFLERAEYTISGGNRSSQESTTEDTQNDG